ncbi:hypothetical protein [Aurantiacibacter zhengii]|uniref:Uncharacterized protein n=1 Tax=Aurantiacibacter zhengii TaxID=2307003 RepID=A0A418NU15_9SPHN|nr:hypothetical protein [Aurantiacibacter zhengii]RIV87489.1 hypothetical protein D2V07_03825 [Aurantiacibacter zhengii]
MAYEVIKHSARGLHDCGAYIETGREFDTYLRAAQYAMTVEFCALGTLHHGRRILCSPAPAGTVTDSASFAAWYNESQGHRADAFPVHAVEAR